MYTVVVGLVTLVGLLVIRFRVCSYYRLSEGYETAGLSLEELELRLGEKFNTVACKGDMFARALMLVWCLEVWLTSHLAAQKTADPGAFYVFQPEGGVWVFPAIVGALGIGILATRFWTMRSLGEYAQDYERYCNWKNNILGEPVCKVFSATTIILSLLMLALASDCYTKVNSTGITVNPLFSFGAHQRRWSEVDRLVHAKAIALPGGMQVERSVWQIRFKDGSLWSSDNAPGFHSERDYFLFITYATIQSGAPIDEVTLIQDADR